MREVSNSAVQSHYALYRCMSVMLWNAIITVGISVTSLIIASTLCTYYYTLYMYVHVLSSYTHMVYMYSVWNIERSWPGFENEGRISEMAKKRAVRRPGSISKHQELVRQVSEGQ